MAIMAPSVDETSDITRRHGADQAIPIHEVRARSLRQIGFLEAESRRAAISADTPPRDRTCRTVHDGSTGPGGDWVPARSTKAKSPSPGAGQRQITPLGLV
jgi:hypothetical protein